MLSRESWSSENSVILLECWISLRCTLTAIGSQVEPKDLAAGHLPAGTHPTPRKPLDGYADQALELMLPVRSIPSVRNLGDSSNVPAKGEQR